MLTRSWKPIVGLLLAVAAVFIGQGMLLKANQNQISYQLLPPAVENAHAQSNTISDILDQEAGMSAYIQAPSGIDLEPVKSVFRIIEYETDEFIIGSVAVKDYNDTAEDVHVFVSSDGWMVAYYLNSDPASKIVDVALGSTSGGTKLETVLQTMAAAAGIGYGEPSFYDFRYPEATHLMMVVGNDFTIQMPSVFRYYEHGGSTGTCGYYRLDGEFPSSFTKTEVETTRGTYSVINSNLLLPDRSHSVVVSSSRSDCYATIVLVYSES